MKNKFLLAAAIIAGTCTSQASDIQFSYATPDSEIKYFGYSKREAYDVALKIIDPVYVGAKVSSISVPFDVPETACSDLSGWVAEELSYSDNSISTDMQSTNAKVENGMLTIVFDTPYTIPVEGLWVGYSFNITSLREEGKQREPVATVTSDKNLDTGLWIHTSRTKAKWTDIGTTEKAVSAMSVAMITDFGDHDVAIYIPSEAYSIKDENYNLPAMIINHGGSALQDITYSYTIGSTTGNGSYHFNEPVEAVTGVANIELTLEGHTELGEFPFNITVETSNGGPNTDAMRYAEGKMNVWTAIPETRPLVEEFTGLGCAFCPRGYVVMEEMSNRYPDKFIGMAYHSQEYESGGMVTVPDYQFPFHVSSYPYSDINREYGMDPGEIPSRWESFTKEITPADVQVTLKWDDTHEVLEATADVTFAKDMENANYKIAVALMANGLTNPSWLQSNVYSSSTAGDGIESPLWDIFLNGGSKVKGLVFNDVVAYFKDIRGVEGSVPPTIKAGDVISYSTQIPFSEVKNLNGANFINEGATLHAVAILLDGNGIAVNCNKSAKISTETSGVEGIDTEELQTVATTYYNLQGIVVEKPSNGIYLRTDILSDGSVRTQKVAIP